METKYLQSTINSSHNLPQFSHTNKINRFYPPFCISTVKIPNLSFSFNLFPRFSGQYSNSLPSNCYRSSKKPINLQPLSFKVSSLFNYLWKFGSFMCFSYNVVDRCYIFFICGWDFDLNIKTLTNKVNWHSRGWWYML